VTTFADRTIFACFAGLAWGAFSLGCGAGSGVPVGASAGAGGALTDAGGASAGASGASGDAAATAGATGAPGADAGDGSAATLGGDGKDGNGSDAISDRTYPNLFTECVADAGVENSDATPGSGAACGPLPSCGGDPIGQWRAGANVGTECIRGAVTGGCALAGPAPGDSCASLVYMPGALSGTSRVGLLALPLPENPSVSSSTLILYPSGDFGIDLRIAGSARMHFSHACLTAHGGNPTCTELASQVAISQSGFPDFTCLTASGGGCDCSWTFEGGTENWGRWRTDGNVLLLDGIAPDGSAEQFTYDFCVRGNELDLTAAASGPFLGSDSYGQAGRPFGLRTLALEPAPGNLLHWDGVKWSTDGSGNALSFRAAWGSGPNDIWAVGTRGTPETLSPALDGSETGGTVAHWDGTAWSQAEINTPLASLQPFAAVTAFQSVWGSGPSDVWAVGTAGNGDPISHWDGAAWSNVTVSANPRLTSVWGSGPNDVWAVGDNFEGSAVILHYDGNQWSTAPSTFPGNGILIGSLNGVWGSGPRDVWAVGSFSLANDPVAAGILHWDGSAWSSAMTGTSGEHFTAVWGSGPADVWVVDSASNFVHWNGTTWSPFMSGRTQIITSLWGTGPNDVWAVGDGILHWNGTAWSPSSSAATATELAAVWGTGPSDIWGIR
jgi:hypothetical protein